MNVELMRVMQAAGYTAISVKVETGIDSNGARTAHVVIEGRGPVKPKRERRKKAEPVAP